MSEKEEEIKENKEEIVDAQESTNENSSKEFGEAEPIDPIEKLENDLLEEKNKYLRLYAEFENFRRRTAKERIELIGSASADLMKEMLTILDDFDRAIQSNETVDDLQAVKEGFQLLHNKLLKLLEGKGLKSFDSMDKNLMLTCMKPLLKYPLMRKEKKE